MRRKRRRRNVVRINNKGFSFFLLVKEGRRTAIWSLGGGFEIVVVLLQSAPSLSPMWPGALFCQFDLLWGLWEEGFFFFSSLHAFFFLGGRGFITMFVPRRSSRGRTVSSYRKLGRGQRLLRGKTTPTITIKRNIFALLLQPAGPPLTSCIISLGLSWISTLWFTSDKQVVSPHFHSLVPGHNWKKKRGKDGLEC